MVTANVASVCLKISIFLFLLSCDYRLLHLACPLTHSVLWLVVTQPNVTWLAVYCSVPPSSSPSSSSAEAENSSAFALCLLSTSQTESLDFFCLQSSINQRLIRSIIQTSSDQPHGDAGMSCAAERNRRRRLDELDPSCIICWTKCEYWELYWHWMKLTSLNNFVYIKFQDILGNKSWLRFSADCWGTVFICEFLYSVK